MATYINSQKCKSDFILNCIEQQMAQREPDFGRIGQVWKASEVAPLELPEYDIRVVAGFPIPLDNDERSRKIEILSMLCPHPDASYLIRVQGDSMIDADIHNDDILVVDKSKRNPTENEVARCERNGEYTIKYVRKHDGHCWLVPANPAYPEIEIHEGDNFNVWGTVTFVIHRPHNP